MRVFGKVCFGIFSIRKLGSSAYMPVTVSHYCAKYPEVSSHNSIVSADTFFFDVTSASELERAVSDPSKFGVPISHLQYSWCNNSHVLVINTW